MLIPSLLLVSAILSAGQDSPLPNSQPPRTGAASQEAASLGAASLGAGRESKDAGPEKTGSEKADSEKAGAKDDLQSVIVALGAAGAEEYAEPFREWADRWRKAAETGGAEWREVGRGENAESSDRDVLKSLLEQLNRPTDEPLWLVLIGHGTFDGRRTKFNLRGADLTAEQLADWLKPFKRPVAVINCASASGPFVNKLSAPGRVVVTATKSGYQHNYARFGDYMSSAISNPKADLDKDGQTSLLEAFLTASAGVADFYEQEGRLATEHGLIDDNGDKLGAAADWYRGVRATRSAKDGAEVDGLRAGQFHLIRSPQELRMAPEVRARRDRLELEIAALRGRRQTLGDREYYEQLEGIALEIARLYSQSESDSTPE